MSNFLNERMAAVSRLISIGDPESALIATREILANKHGSHPLVQNNCAGFLIDAGERLDREDVVLEGLEMLAKLRTAGTFAEGSSDCDNLRYNLANGRSAPLHMASRRRGRPDIHVVDLTEHEAVVALYYESTELLRRAKPETVINCAAMLRLECRVYEAIDLLDGVAQRNPEHPNAHMKLAEVLWLAASLLRGRDSKLESLLVAACVHYSRAIDGFVALGELEFAEGCRQGLRSLRELATNVLDCDLDAAIADVGNKRFGTVRFGEPVGLPFLARSPYRDEDDMWLAEDIAPEFQDIVSDAAGTFCVGRALLAQSDEPAVRLPRWGSHSPDASAHLRNAAVRQFWSVMEKVAWLVNKAFKVGLRDSECSFATLFRAPSDKARKALSLAVGTRFYPALDIENAGLRALSGLSCAFDTQNTSAYVPLKRLRHTVEHRVPDSPATRDDAAFLQGIARAAILHGLDAILMHGAAT
jgi:hypothetical protein